MEERREDRGIGYRRVEHCPMHNANQKMLRIVGTGFALVITIMGVLSFALLNEVRHRDEAQDRVAKFTAKERARIDTEFRKGQYVSCGRGNDIRAWIRYRSTVVDDSAATNRQTFPILDCRPYLSGKQGKPLPHREQVAFIRSVYPAYKVGN